MKLKLSALVALSALVMTACTASPFAKTHWQKAGLSEKQVLEQEMACAKETDAINKQEAEAERLMANCMQSNGFSKRQ